MFKTESGLPVPAVTAEQMREIDRLASEEFGLGLLQMMENAGRSLAEHALTMLEGRHGGVSILAGPGGNGGGGLCGARHLSNRGVSVSVILDRDPQRLAGAALAQLGTLLSAGVTPVHLWSDVREALRRSEIVVDALIGYGLRGAPRGRTAELIEICNETAARVIALDLPSGLNATTGAAPGAVVRADRTLTLALPKTGLAHRPGELYLGDVGIPPAVYARLGLAYEPPFLTRHWVRLYAI